jgi:integrase
LEIAGDKPIADYNKADARLFKSVLFDLPPNRSKSKELRGLEVRAAAKRARELGLAPMSVVNINKQISIISGLFDWLSAHYDCVTTNPFSKSTIAVKSSARDERDPFTVAELSAIFKAPVFIGCESERHWQRPGALVLRESAKFWIPLLGLYTGARLNELCKLRAKDIRSSNGIDYIDINTDAHEDGAIDPGVKTSASSRQLPVHADLISFRFLSLVATRRESGTERLFPELRPDAYGKLSDGFGKYFARFLKSIGIKRDKLDFHSFRHTWTDACRNSRIPIDVIYALKGEALKGTLARYGHGRTDLEILDEEMRKLQFKGLDLSHLVPPVACDRTTQP